MPRDEPPTNTVRAANPAGAREQGPPTSVADRLPLHDAIHTPNGRYDNFLPSRVARDALVRDAGAVRRLRDRFAGGDSPSPAETVDVPKWAGGTRPVIDLDVEDRVVYEALVALVAAGIPDGALRAPASPADRDARAAEICRSAATHVLSADIDSCFDRMSHERLAAMLRALVPEEPAVGSLIDLLRTLVGSGNGLPQGPPASWVLGNVYLSAVDRSLDRASIPYFRLNDDYLVPVSSAVEGDEVAERLRTALAAVRLELHPGKTRLWTRGAFAAARRRRPAADILGDVASRHGSWGATDEQSGAVRDALADLAATGSPVAIDLLPALWSSLPHLTKPLARYARAILRTPNASRAVTVVDAILRDDAGASAWQLAWLYHCLFPAKAELPPTTIARARASLLEGAEPWSVRGRAALLLSMHGALAVGEVADIARDAPAAAQPDLVAAVANVVPGNARTDALRRLVTRPLLAEVAALVEETGVRDK
jgi:hypothetical protein